MSYPAASIDLQHLVFRIPSKPLRTVLRWQVFVTLLCAAAAALFSGAHGAWSALLGGTVSLLAGLAFAWVVSRDMSRDISHGRAPTAGGTLATALKAEAAKIGVVIVLLWAVFATYERLAAMIFLGTFFVTILIFSMAFFVRDEGRVNGGTGDGR